MLDIVTIIIIIIIDSVRFHSEEGPSIQFFGSSTDLNFFSFSVILFFFWQLSVQSRRHF